MNKIKAALAPVLLKMGFTQDAIDKMLPDTDGVEPVIDSDAFLKQAQDFSKPLLKGHFEAELKSHFLGLHMEKFVKELATASEGLISPAEVVGKKPEEVLAMYKTKAKELSGLKETEKDQRIEMLTKQLVEKETEFNTKLSAATTEFEGKENSRLVQTNLMKNLAGKKLTVTPDFAAEKLLRDLQDTYVLKAEGDSIAFYDKADPTKRVKNKADVNFLSADEVLTDLLPKYNWQAQSNGGQGGGNGGGNGAADTVLTGLPKNTDGSLNTTSVSPLVQAAIAAGQIPAKA